MTCVECNLVPGVLTKNTLCRPCYCKKWYRNNKLDQDTKHKEYHKKNPERFRARTVGKYGLSLQEYDTMLLNQGGVCKACKRPPGKKRLCVDHVHDDTQKVRGLLCHRCNRVLGQVYDNIELLEQLALYLKGS